MRSWPISNAPSPTEHRHRCGDSSVIPRKGWRDEPFQQLPFGFAIAVGPEQQRQHHANDPLRGVRVSVGQSMVSEFHTTVAHLREVLGDQTYESLVHKGEAMTMAAVVAYAYDQMDRARRQLNQPG